MSDSTKSAHTFQCRNSLWAKFEQMAHELECSVDYLINDAMKQYARQRGFGGRLSVPPSSSNARASGAPTIQPTGYPSQQPAAFPARAATAPSPVAQPPGPPPLAPSLPPRAPAAAPVARSVPNAPPPRAPAVPPRRPAPPPPVSRAPAAAPRAAAAPAMPGFAPPQSIPRAPVAAAPANRYPLFVYYMGQRYPVAKDRFIIGRGRQSSDLTIRDPNVSRQHAMIEFLNGQYHIVDMGSTNGIEHAGQRIQRRVVQDGDTYRVCDHELRVSFQ